MRLDRIAIRRFLPALVATGCIVTAGVVPAGIGITLFSGVEPENRLRAHLQENGEVSETDRYKLYIPAEKLDIATSVFTVSYSEDYDGVFDEEDIELRIKGDEVALSCVRWDRENLNVEIIPAEPVPAETRKVSIVFSDVRNPRRTGTHHFNAFIQPPTPAGETPPALLNACLNPPNDADESDSISTADSEDTTAESQDSSSLPDYIGTEPVPVFEELEEQLPVDVQEALGPPRYIGTWILQFARNAN